MEPSSPPWRTFDAPPVLQPAADAASAGGGHPGGVTIQPTVLAAAALAVVIGVLAVFVALGGFAVAPGGDSERPGDSHAAAAVGELVVDVTGAVVSPGVYHLGTGARIGDAIDAAGGFGPRVDADRVAGELNLAALVEDGQQIRVPSRDDASSGPGGNAEGGPSGGSGGHLIDVNSATQAELESLPGIGPVTAGKIIAAREEIPFASIEDLRQRGLLGEKTFDSIRALITVG